MSKQSYAARLARLRESEDDDEDEIEVHHHEGDWVRVAGHMQGGGQIGMISQVQGSFYGVDDHHGGFLGYYHGSDLEPVDDGDPELHDYDED